MFDKVNDFVNDKRFELVLNDKSLYIKNYNRIVSLDDNSVIFTYYLGKIKITGINIKLRKLLDKELLITGKVLNIEVNYE